MAITRAQQVRQMLEKGGGADRIPTEFEKFLFQKQLQLLQEFENYKDKKPIEKRQNEFFEMRTGTGKGPTLEAKEGGRELLKQGFRPTVEGGAPGTFGILTRLQAIYEGISPNQAAAEKNVKALMAELKRVSQVELGGVSDDAVEKLGKVIKKDVEKI